MNSKQRITIAALAFVACADYRRGRSEHDEPEPDASASSTADAGRDAAAGDVGPSFAVAIEPLLRASCSRCHAASAQASGTALVLSGVAQDDFAQVVRLVTVASPASSRLVTKARGDGHGGGAIWPQGSPELQLVTQWITFGARP